MNAPLGTPPVIPVLGIPYLNRLDLLYRCLRSIDHPVAKLVIIQNGRQPFDSGKVNAFVNEIVHIVHPNAGVAASWNEIIMLNPAPWWMIVNNDIEFAPGDLAKMAQAADAHQHSTAILFANHGHSFFAITKRGVTNVGLFDYNIYPAYCEDCEYMWRLHCVGETYIDVQGCNSVHGLDVTGKHASSTIMSDQRLRERNGTTHGNNFAYYRAKTGGMPGEETFKHPFNNPGIPHQFIAYDPDFREKNQW